MHGFKDEGTTCAFLQPAKCMQGGKGHMHVSRTARPDTFGSDTGGFRGSLYAGESREPPAETSSRYRVRNRGQAALAGEQIPSCVSG